MTENLTLAMLGKGAKNGNPPGYVFDYFPALRDKVAAVWIPGDVGGVNITVPRDVNVEVRGTGIMGGFKQLDHRAEEADAPTLRIGGFALMGGVDVKFKKNRRWFRKS